MVFSLRLESINSKRLLRVPMRLMELFESSNCLMLSATPQMSESRPISVMAP